MHSARIAAPLVVVALTACSAPRPDGLAQCEAQIELPPAQGCVSSTAGGWGAADAQGFQSVVVEGSVATTGVGVPPGACFDERNTLWIGPDFGPEQVTPDALRWLQIEEGERTWTAGFRTAGEGLAVQVGDVVTLRHRFASTQSQTIAELIVEGAAGIIAYATDGIAPGDLKLTGDVTLSAGAATCFFAEECGQSTRDGLDVQVGAATASVPPLTTTTIGDLVVVNAMLWQPVDQARCTDGAPAPRFRFAMRRGTQ